jgi:hypothetical protein
MINKQYKPAEEENILSNLYDLCRKKEKKLVKRTTMTWMMQ